MLAMVERKIFDNRLACKLDDRELWYDAAQFEQFKAVITSLNITTQQIGALLRCVSTFKFDDINFVPLTPARANDNNGRYLPLPESVILTNLRDTVVSLADARVAIAVRRNFISKIPIPGAIFDGALLTNADVIMPANYSPDNLRDDVYAVKNWIEAATDLRNARDKWFSQIQLSEMIHGNESMLVCSNSETLRIEADEHGSRVLGDVNDFWFRSKMSDQMIFYGTYHLGGEIASVARYVYPGYSGRTKQANGMMTKRSFREVVLAVEA